MPEIVLTDEERDSLEHALDGLDEKVAEAFALLRDPVRISDLEMEELRAYFRLRLETLGVAMLTFGAVASLCREKGFGHERALSKFASTTPDEFSGEVLGTGPAQETFERITDRASAFAEERMSPIKGRLRSLLNQAANEASTATSFLEREKELLVEHGLAQAARNLDDEMYRALNALDEWFLDRLQGETVDA